MVVFGIFVVIVVVVLVGVVLVSCCDGVSLCVWGVIWLLLIFYGLLNDFVVLFGEIEKDCWCGLVLLLVRLW